MAASTPGPPRRLMSCPSDSSSARCGIMRCGALCLWRVCFGGSFISSSSFSSWLDCRGELWHATVGGGSAKLPIIDAHKCGLEEWAYMTTKGTRERDHLERESQTRPYSTAKRVAAVRELTPSLW